MARNDLPCGSLIDLFLLASIQQFRHQNAPHVPFNYCPELQAKTSPTAYGLKPLRDCASHRRRLQALWMKRPGALLNTAELGDRRGGTSFDCGRGWRRPVLTPAGALAPCPFL